MTLCLDLSAAAHERAGLGRYAACLAQALLEQGAPLTAFINDPRDGQLRPPLNQLRTFTVHLPRKRWRLRAALSYFGGPGLRRTFPNVTLFHATEHLLPIIPGARSVFTLHDTAYLLYPQHHLLQNRLYLTLMMPRFLARADRIICVSENTRRDALRFYKLNPNKVCVIPEGVEPRFAPISDPQSLRAVRERYSLPQRFILYVGTIEPRKNLNTLLEAYAVLRRSLPEVGLVIAGSKGWLYEGFFEKLRALGLESHVTLTGFVPEADLPALLNSAEVFAYPSLFEGFGLPPLEAMACGVPVVASNAASLPEVVGEAGILLAPRDVMAWVEALSAVLLNPTLRADLRERGLRRAARFTWEATARQTLTVYRSLEPSLEPATRHS
ncbi:MAG: glycosyltransferase family 1 protein [Anaerolineales bacterium]|nr:glycosyltransferase family 1 protein [Anaerolineales bacterium]